MLSEIHMHLWAERAQLPNSGKIALAQTTCCLKATATALIQKGVWKGAWELTYLPELFEAEGGVSMDEKASTGRFLREKAAVEKILEDARSADKGPGRRKDD